MPVQMHKFATEAFEAKLKEYEEDIQKRVRWLAGGEADIQRASHTVVTFSIWNVCILLILGRDEVEALRYFRQAVDYGLRSLEAKGSTAKMQAHHAIFEHNEDGLQSVKVREIPQSSGPAVLSIGDYDRVLWVTVAFGDRAQIDTVARYPESRYRNPNEIVDESYFDYLRGVKAFLLGDEMTAKREVMACIASSNPVTREHKEAFLALLDRDISLFRHHVEKRLQAHKKQYARRPYDQEGYICQPLFMLCRLAIDLGLEVEEGPYLPVHLLPNFGLNAKAPTL